VNDDDRGVQWLHDLRNAVNTALISTSVVRGLLDQGDAARALPFVIDAQDACKRCRVLLSDALPQALEY